MNELERRDSLSESRKSPETSRNTPPVPDRETAAVLSSLIDRARAAMGWNRLPEREQDIAIITWYEILSDAGVRFEQYTDCYRAAQQRKRELLTQGQPLSIVTPHDLCAELDRVRAMHREIDRTPLLPSRARGACSRCFGTGFARMPDGSVKPGCQHEEWTPVDESELEMSEERRREEVQRQAEFMRDALSKVGQPRPAPGPVAQPKPKGDMLKCDNPKCGREIDTYLLRFEPGDACGDLLNRYSSDEAEPELCRGVFVKIPAAG